jgi:hypothetical protein
MSSEKRRVRVGCRTNGNLTVCFNTGRLWSLDALREMGFEVDTGHAALATGSDASVSEVSGRRGPKAAPKAE